MLIKPTSGGGGVMFQVVSGVSVLVDGVPRWLEPNSVALRSQFPLPIMPFEFQMFEPSSKSPGATSDKVHRRLELDSINSIHPPMSPYSRLLHPSSYPSGRDRPEITTTVPPKPSLTPSPPHLASFGTVRDDSRKALRQLANSGPKTVVPVPKRH